MKRRMNKRMATAALAGAMVLSMNGMAWAAVTEFDFTKVVTTDGNTYAPNTAFSFTIEKGLAGTVTDDKGVSKVVYAGVDGGLSFKDDNNSISFTPGDTVAATYNGTGTITVAANVKETFKAPGVYHYVLKETAGTYDGITYDPIEKHIYVYVVNDGTDLIVEAVTVADGKDGTEAKSGTLKFTNIYGDGTSNDKIHDLRVTKTVSGNQGEKDRKFEFTITITPSTVGEKYKAVIENSAGEQQGEPLVIEDSDLTDSKNDATATVYLKDDETLHIYGLSEQDTYTVTEEDCSKDGYTTTVNGIKGYSGTGNLTEDNVEVVFENNKNVGPATGVAMTFAPYVLLVAAAGGLGAVVLGKKKREDDEI